MASRISAGRVREEIAEAIVFLASDKAAFKREPRLPPTAAPQRLPDKPRDWT